MLKYLFLLIIAILCILAGVFKWFFFLSVFSWRFKPKNDFDINILRGIAIITGIILIFMCIKWISV